MTDGESTSNLGFALLSLLARGPSTGYQLSQWMQRPVGYFWTARHSQIYPELARLEGRGLLRHKVIDGAGPRETKRYTITARGRRALRDWVGSELEEQPVRDLETLRLWSVWLVDQQTALDLVAQRRREHAERLAAYERELAEIIDDPGAADPGAPIFASVLTLEGGVRTRRAAVEWCDWMTDRLEHAYRGS